VGICIYLVTGKSRKKVPSDKEYNHQNGYASWLAGRNEARTDPSDPVRKLPVPYTPLVRLSAIRRLGKISQREVRAILSGSLSLVVFFIPTTFDENLFITARINPERIKARIRSIRNEYTASNPVLPWSGLKNLKNIAL